MIEYLLKVMSFNLFLKPLVRISAVNIVKNFLVMLKDLLETLLRLLKKIIQKTAEVILLVVKFLTELQLNQRI